MQRPAPRHVVKAKSRKTGQVSQKRTWGCDYDMLMGGGRGVGGQGGPPVASVGGSASCLSDPSPWKPSFLPSERPSRPCETEMGVPPREIPAQKGFPVCSSHLQSGLFPACWEGPRASSRGADEGSGCWHLVALDPFPPVLPVVFISRCQRGDRDTVSGSDLPEVIERARGGAEARTAAWGLAFVPLTRSVSKPKQQER